MLRTLGYIARRREALRQSCPALHLNLLPEVYTDNRAYSETCDPASASSSGSLSDPRQAVSEQASDSKPRSPATPPTRSNPCGGPGPLVTPGYAQPIRDLPLGRACSEAPPPAAAADLRKFLHQPYQHQQTRYASSSAAAKAKARGGGGGTGGKPVGASAPSRVRTPDWARMPLQLDALPTVMRRRAARLLTLQKQLQAEVAKAEAGGWAAAGKLAEAEAAVRALPIPPKDAGESDLAEATAPGTSFDAAHAAMKELCRRGVCLDAGRHLVPLLRKASSPEHLSAALGLLRTNHLVQAAVRMGAGAHVAAHGGLHGALVEECRRLRTAAPLLELWDSLYEHGLEPSREAAQAAVQTAVALRDGTAAAALLALSSQYGKEPLAEAEASAVLAMLDAGSPDEAAKLRQLLPRLGFPGAA